MEAPDLGSATEIGLRVASCPNGGERHTDFRSPHGHLYTIAEGGSLYGLDLGSGSVASGRFNSRRRFRRIGASILSATRSTRLSGSRLRRSVIGPSIHIDIRDPHRPVVRQLLLSNTTTGGIWGRGGPVIGESGLVYGSTADGSFNPKLHDTRQRRRRLA